jgi:hypothetical protein
MGEYESRDESRNPVELGVEKENKRLGNNDIGICGAKRI